VPWYWRTAIQLRAESSTEGRVERVVGGPHKGAKGWLFITVVFAGIAFFTWLALMIIVNHVLQ